MRKILFLGVGRVAKAVAAQSLEVFAMQGTTRNPEKCADLQRLRIVPLLCSVLSELPVRDLCSDSYVLVSFPPDGRTDAAVAPMLSRARSVIYISSTSVYGDTEGLVDEDTPCLQNDDNRNRITAENIWRRSDATILRAPGLYDRCSGLHTRLRATSSGAANYPMLDQGYNPTLGQRYRVSSRIHLDDLAQIILAAFVLAPRRKLYVVGDLAPAPQSEVLEWLCKRMSLLPQVPATQVHHTQRTNTNRAVVPTKVLTELGIKLRYPTYKEGYEACLTADYGAL